MMINQRGQVDMIFLLIFSVLASLFSFKHYFFQKKFKKIEIRSREILCARFIDKYVRSEVSSILKENRLILSTYTASKITPKLRPILEGLKAKQNLSFIRLRYKILENKNCTLFKLKIIKSLPLDNTFGLKLSRLPDNTVKIRDKLWTLEIKGKVTKIKFKFITKNRFSAFTKEVSKIVEANQHLVSLFGQLSSLLF